MNGAEYPDNYTLLEFIRNKAVLKGTKFMCKEGGCGCCAVIANNGTAKSSTVPINSVRLRLSSQDIYITFASPAASISVRYKYLIEKVLKSYFKSLSRLHLQEHIEGK